LSTTKGTPALVEPPLELVAEALLVKELRTLLADD
jgi:hypothetical protein